MIALDYTMNRVRKGTRTFFYPTINGKRFTKTNFLRKYDAKQLVKSCIEKYGIDKLLKLSN